MMGFANVAPNHRGRHSYLTYKNRTKAVRHHNHCVISFLFQFFSCMFVGQTSSPWCRGQRRVLMKTHPGRNGHAQVLKRNNKGMKFSREWGTASSWVSPGKHFLDMNQHHNGQVLGKAPACQALSQVILFANYPDLTSKVGLIFYHSYFIIEDTQAGKVMIIHPWHISLEPKAQYSRAWCGLSTILRMGTSMIPTWLAETVRFRKAKELS